MNQTIKRVMCFFLTFLIAAFPMSTWAYEILEPDAPPEDYLAEYPTDLAGGCGDVIWSEQEPQFETVLDGKRVMFIGDSLLAGYGLDDYGESWCGLLESIYGMAVTNNAVSGSTLSTGDGSGNLYGDGYSPICRRYLPAKRYDIIFITGGANDWRRGIPIGADPESRDTGNLMGAMNRLLDRLEARYPQSQIVYMTTWNSIEDANALGYTIAEYNDALVQICQTRGIDCFMACDSAVSGIIANDTAFREEYFLGSNDIWHLNSVGHSLFLPYISQWLQETIVEHYIISGFYDVSPQDWYAEAVAYAVEAGLTNGTSDTLFSPYMNTQRGMIVSMLYRMAGSPDVSGLSQPFEDVPMDSYCYDAVIWAYDTGITTGTDETHFRPADELTREQLATFLFRLSGEEAVPSDLSVFTDAALVSDFAYPAVAWAVQSDILHGCGNDLLEPHQGATRAELVQLLCNYINAM